MGREGEDGGKLEESQKCSRERLYTRLRALSEDNDKKYFTQLMCHDA